MVAQPATGFTNTYAEPWSLFAPMSSAYAPTTTVSLLIATAAPKRSLAAPSEAVSLAVSVMVAQPAIGFTNTYAEPWLLFAPMSSTTAPTTTVSPLIATAKPKRSLAAPSEAVSLAVSDIVAQPATGFTNTYAEPWLACAPMVSAMAPTTTVSPLIATAAPKSSPAAPSEAVSSACWMNGSTTSG